MSRNILVAEDESFIANLYRAEFDSRGARTTLAVDGKQAIEALKKERFDLVLLDLMMPVMDGYEVLSFCLAHKIRIPVVVVLTNLSQDITKAKCRELGAEDYIIKSDVTAEQVWEKIKIYLPVD